MSDIKIRLRTTGDPWPQYADVPLCVEAAKKIDELEAEVERLRAENALMRAGAHEYHQQLQRYSIEHERLLSIIADLRAALKLARSMFLDMERGINPSRTDFSKIEAALTGGKE